MTEGRAMRPLLYISSLSLALAATTALPAHTQSPTPQQPSSAAAARTYVGQDTCVACHDTEGTAIHQTAHGKAQNPRTPAGARGCESCHGPGSAHIEDPAKPDSIRRFAKIKPRETSETCLTCHNRGNHTQWKGSMHDARNLSCTTCHL